MKQFCYCLIFFLGPLVGVGQEAETYPQSRPTQERSHGTKVLLGQNNQPGNKEIVGDVYLNPDYWITSFVMYNRDTLTSFPARLDLRRNVFDVKAGEGEGIVTLSGSQVRTLVWTQSPQFFVNGREYKNEDQIPYYGFFQILSDGELTLLKMVELVFKPADRSLSHSVGSQEDQFIKNPRFYYAIGSSAWRLPNKRKLLKLFEAHSAEIEKFVLDNRIDLTKESHLIAVFDYYNSLFK